MDVSSGPIFLPKKKFISISDDLFVEKKKKNGPRENHCVPPGSNLLIYQHTTRKKALGVVTKFGVTKRKFHKNSPSNLLP